MVPRTYPSTFAANGQQQMVVYFLTSISGLQRWVDYIPVKLTQGGTENSYNNDGFISIALLPELTSQTQAWKEYIPVYQDDAATDAWQVSSVGFIPYNYDKFEDASLFLDFTNGGALDSRITFSRGSNATVTGSNGLIQYAPHNLLTFSEQFDNAAWIKQSSATVIANSVSAPDGTTTADTLVLVASANSALFTTITAPVGTYTISVYARAATAQKLRFVRFNATDGSSVSANFNVTTEWQRLTFTVSQTVGTSSWFIQNASDAVARNVFIWGAQLELSSTARTY